MRVLVCGGRDYTDRKAIYTFLDYLHAEHSFTVLIAGGARGADTIAAEWAREHGIGTRIFVANWVAFSKAAGPIRNAQMLTEGKPDLVVAFPGGKGTQDMIDRASAAGVEVILSTLRSYASSRTAR
jgi:hypothetical protein